MHSYSIKYLPTLQYFIENRDVISAARIPARFPALQATFSIGAMELNSPLTSNRVGIKLLKIGKPEEQK
jgi:hypothetical protein